jgi:undecaprenyl-phosphate 4-deoxy-4-formamido-L-arabinose transferase
MKVSVVVPVYHGAATIEELARRLQPVLDAHAEAYELILVNDGSPDDSWPAIQKLAAAHPWVHGMDLMRNYGQHNALLCGVRAARYESVVTMDDDLQNPPEEVPKLLAGLSGGLDVVYGAPDRIQHGLLRGWASHVTKWVLQGAMGAATARKVSAFRAFRAGVRDGFAGFRGPYVNLDVMLTWGASRFGAVTVRHDPRAAGASNYTFRKLARHALNMITGFSILPLRLASVMGFLFTLFGFGALVYVLGCYFLSGTTVPGFPFLASLIAILSGAQLFALGVIGEYLALMHFRVMDRPAYVVRCSSERK